MGTRFSLGPKKRSTPVLRRCFRPDLNSSKLLPDAKDTDVQPSGMLDWLVLQTLYVFSSVSVTNMSSMSAIDTPIGVACADFGWSRPSIIRRESLFG